MSAGTAKRLEKKMAISASHGGGEGVTEELDLDAGPKNFLNIAASETPPLSGGSSVGVGRAVAVADADDGGVNASDTQLKRSLKGMAAAVEIHGSWSWASSGYVLRNYVCT